MSLNEIANGRYRRRGTLGSGAFGEVLLYFDTKLQREVAVKICRRDGEQSDLTAEAKRLAQLDHPNIVRVHDVIELGDSGTAIVMQLVRGEALNDVITRPRSPALTRRWIDQIASALAEAHRAGLTHADLHPGNVAITASSAGGDPVLLDFGLSRLIGESLEPHPDDVYHAPEATSGVVPASDFWNLGLIAAELVTGRTVASMLGGGATDDVRDCVLAVVSGAADPEVAGLIERLLDRDSNRRATRDEVAAFLRTGGQPSIQQKGVAVGMASAAVPGLHSEVWRVTARHRVEHRWFTDGGWTAWSDFEFERPALDVAAISAWPDHVEVFVLDTSGRVWHRWWWRKSGWDQQYHDLGQPFSGDEPRGISALSAHAGHMDVFVETIDRRVANLWFSEGNDGWRRCEGKSALQDGWWPFSV